MHINSIDILNFRNLRSPHIDFDRGFNAFYGDNAQGKSNLLEAIYSLAYLKGFRTDRAADMISFGEDRAVLGVSVQTSEGASVRLSLEMSSRGRRPYIDGAPCRTARSYLGVLRVVLFVPSDVGFLYSSPAERRTMLDRNVFNLHPSYLPDLDMYQRVVRQKSAALRGECPEGPVLDAYDEQLAVLGCRILEARHDYFSRLAPYVSKNFGGIFADTALCRPVYKSSVMRDVVEFGNGGNISASDLASQYRRYLETSRPREIAARQVLGGPHRDDWTLVLDGVPAKNHASQGQQRAMILAMKISDIECLRTEAGISPVFLLDDVSGELDPERYQRLFGLLDALGVQTFITTTSKSNIPSGVSGGMFRVSAGEVYDDRD